MSLFSRFLNDTLDPDRGLQAATTAAIETTAVRKSLGLSQHLWNPGDPLKLLLAGYVGTRNTGADVRVAEMIRQFRTILGDDVLNLSVMTVDKTLTAGYFRGTRQVTLPPVFPAFLLDECPRNHGVIACEGSMFKSKFANALSTMMAGALGMASIEGKFSIGYGAEAGEMDPSLKRFVKRHVADSLVICRNEPSRGILESMGIRTTSGTDTAWTFTPAPAERGHALLKEKGWDGKTPILAVCPINPFWWPVKPDLMKAAAMQLTGQYKSSHYKSVYFHHESSQAAKKNEAYLNAIAHGVNAFAKENKVFPILVGMEQLDRGACERLKERLDTDSPLFISDQYDMYDLVSVLHRCTWMLSSRFHAMVTSMPGGVISAGITMDERIRNLLALRGQSHLCMEVDQPDLEEAVLTTLRTMKKEKALIRKGIESVLPGELKRMAEMGMTFREELQRVYPEFPLKDLGPGWENYLPPLSSEIQDVLEKAA